MYVEIINACYIWERGIEIYVMLMVTLITVSKRDTGFSVVVTDSRSEGSLQWITEKENEHPHMMDPQDIWQLLLCLEDEILKKSRKGDV